ncbi:MAG: hypothetical protein J6M60_04010 [Clostridia bacterium]|nr:hypothetical protein [Clostridia bacterium]
MSLPINLKPHEKEIIEELKLQGADEKTIKSIVYDFRGKKRELEFLKFLQENRDKEITYKDLIAKKIEIKEKYDEWWGYILVRDNNYFPDCYEVYDPEKYIEEQKNINS